MQRYRVSLTKEQSQFFDEFIRDLKVRGRKTSGPTTKLKIFFEYINNNELDFLALKISEAENFQLELTTRLNSVNENRFSSAVICDIIGVVSNFYEYLKRKDIVFANPFLAVKRVKRNRKLSRNVLNERDINRVLACFRNFADARTLTKKRQFYKCHVILELMYSTGMRVNEAAKLKLSDVNLEQGIIHITDSKTKTFRQGILNEYCRQILRIYIEDTRKFICYGRSSKDKDLLFGSTDLVRWLNEILKQERAKLKAGKFTTHCMRHAVGYHLLRSGCEIRYIQKILGHKSLRSTQIYTRVDKQKLKNVLDEFHPRDFKKQGLKDEI